MAKKYQKKSKTDIKKLPINKLDRLEMLWEIYKHHRVSLRHSDACSQIRDEYGISLPTLHRYSTEGKWKEKITMQTNEVLLRMQADDLDSIPIPKPEVVGKDYKINKIPMVNLPEGLLEIPKGVEFEYENMAVRNSFISLLRENKGKLPTTQQVAESTNLSFARAKYHLDNITFEPTKSPLRALTHEVVLALFQKAMTGYVPAIQTWLKLFEGFTDKKDIRLNLTNEFEGMTVEDIDNELNRYANIDNAIQIYN